MANRSPIKTDRTKQERIAGSLARRYRTEWWFRFCGRLSVFIGLLFVVCLISAVASRGYPAFQQTYLRLTIKSTSDPTHNRAAGSSVKLEDQDYGALVKAAMRDLQPTVQGRPALHQLYALVSESASRTLEHRFEKNAHAAESDQVIWVLALDRVDQYVKGHISAKDPPEVRGLSDDQLGWIDQWKARGDIQLRFNSGFFTSGDSREPEQAGIGAAIVGSFLTLLIVASLSFPIGVAAAIYLEEFAPPGRWTGFLEVNINNLAAVPSIVFGLLGLVVFIKFFGLPRSVPLVGGLVLSLITLPMIIIASRAALKSVPLSIREAAYGMGASRVQVVFHHVLPLSLPTIITSAILALSRAMGESAPLLLVGMVAFVADIPQRVTDPATVLPVQVYLWARSSEAAFVERTSAAILVLLTVLLFINGVAFAVRRIFDKR